MEIFLPKSFAKSWKDSVIAVIATCYSFRAVIQYTRELDSTRPVTFVGNQSPYDDKAVSECDSFRFHITFFHVTKAPAQVFSCEFC